MQKDRLLDGCSTVVSIDDVDILIESKFTLPLRVPNGANLCGSHKKSESAHISRHENGREIVDIILCIQTIHLGLILSLPI